MPNERKEMDTDNIKVLVITANVGSLFEEYGAILRENWMLEFHKLVQTHQPTFIGLHLQEVGGKTLVVNTEQVVTFFKELYNAEKFEEYISVHSFIDEEYTQEKYTALGSSYFIHKSLHDHIEMWNFDDQSFKIVPKGRILHSVSDASCYMKKLKFPLSCYSKKLIRWPRKGFTWTRWRINNRVLDMLNVHLTHDACNLKAALKSPTKFAKHRRRSLQYLIDRLNEAPSDHQILYGDFNVRPDTKGLIDHLMGDIASHHLTKDSDGHPQLLVYKAVNGSTKDLLKIGGRLFEMSSYEAFDHVSDLLQFDKELEWVYEDLFSEMPVSFQPTYPHKENPDDNGVSFSNVRCPSWCDRVIVDKKLFQEAAQPDEGSIYGSYGKNVHIGDHKPVFMVFNFPNR